MSARPEPISPLTPEVPRNRWLLAAGVGSMLVAVLHVVIIFVGPSAYRYFGAGSMAPLAERGSYIPALLTGAFAGVFALWGLYAFSGAKLILHLPFLRPVLFIIGGVYTLRGLLIVIDLYYLFAGKHPAPHMATFSVGSLLIGLCYLLGSRQSGVTTNKTSTLQGESS